MNDNLKTTNMNDNTNRGIYNLKITNLIKRRSF